MGIAARGAFFAASVALTMRRKRESVIETTAQMKLEKEKDGISDVEPVRSAVESTHKTMTRISPA
jgi:hypothetical protein